MLRSSALLIVRRAQSAATGRAAIVVSRNFASQSKDDIEDNFDDQANDEDVKEEDKTDTIPESVRLEIARRQRLQAASALLKRPLSARTRVAKPQAAPKPSLSIPLDENLDLVDPVIVAKVRNLTPDDILAGELLNVVEKLVATPEELQIMLQNERQAMREERDALRALNVSHDHQPSDSSSQTTNYIDEVDPKDEYEQLILDNPESMRRQTVIEQKQVRQIVRGRLLDLDERYDVQLDMQTRAQEEQRAHTQARLKRFEEANAAAIAAGNPGSVDINLFNARPDSQQSAATEAAEYVKLRENVIHEYRAKFGERDGDDYAIDEEESLFEPPDNPPEPRKRTPNAVPMIRPRKVDMFGRSTGSGGRKASRGHCWLKPGTGTVTINGENTALYFQRLTHRAQVIRALVLTNTTGQYDIEAYCAGGGKTGQAGALQFAVARALANQEPALRDRLKKGGLLTRDTRKVERKKPGKYKARKSYTYIRR